MVGIVRLQTANTAILIKIKPGVSVKMAGMGITDKAFQPVQLERDRSPRKTRQQNRQQIITIGVQLDPKRAANIASNHPHRGFGQSQQAGINGSHHMRGLMILPDCHLVGIGIKFSHQPARLQRDPGLPGKLEIKRQAGMGCWWQGAMGEGLLKGEAASWRGDICRAEREVNRF